MPAYHPVELLCIDLYLVGNNLVVANNPAVEYNRCMRTSDPDELAAADAHCSELEFTFPPAQAEVITDIEMRLRRVEAVRPAAALSAMRKTRSGGRKGGRPRKHTPDCAQCGQPMLPEGMKKEINQYDHASGCPLGGRPRKEVGVGGG